MDEAQDMLKIHIALYQSSKYEYSKKSNNKNQKNRNILQSM